MCLIGCEGLWLIVGWFFNYGFGLRCGLFVLAD